MDHRLHKDPNYVDIIGTYHMAFVAFGLWLVPDDVVTVVTTILFIIFAFMLYSRRRKLQNHNVSQDLKLSHIQLMITNFWRFGYLYVIPFLLSMVVISLFGDNSAITALMEMAQDETLIAADPATFDAAVNAAMTANADLKLLCHVIFYVPLTLYIMLKLFKGYAAFKRGDSIDPNAWNVK